MGSGTLQLASYGRQDKLFYRKPTITYFKTVHKRHTNYAIESMPQQFNIKADFGKRVTCVIADIADLMSDIYLVANLPPIGKFIDIQNESGAGNSNIACCAWGNKIGYRLIKQIELEIDDKVIEKQTYDWFNIYNELHMVLGKKEGIDKMIGNIEELTTFSNSKSGYQIHVPLIFWFNKYPELAFPLVSTYNSTIKINIEFNTLDDCLILGPTHYVDIDEEICMFNRGDILYQNVNNIYHHFKFIYHDVILKRLYYIKITNEEMKSTNTIYSQKNDSYYVTPVNKEKLYFNKKKYFHQILNLSLGNTYLLVDYIFLENKERKMFIKNKLQYIINVLQFDNPKNIYHANSKLKINYSNPCTELIFNCSQDYLHNGYLKDVFNYSNNISNDENIINNVSLFMNGQERFQEQNMNHFNLLQPYKYHKHPAPLGIGTFSFSIDNNSSQPAGYCNFSKMSDVEIKLKLKKNVSYNRPVKLRMYTTALRQLTIENGICSLL